MTPCGPRSGHSGAKPHAQKGDQQSQRRHHVLGSVPEKFIGNGRIHVGCPLNDAANPRSDRGRSGGQENVGTCVAGSRGELVAQRLRHVIEGAAGVFADRADCREADHDNQRQHHGVLNSGGAVFREQETFDLSSKGLHENLSTRAGAPHNRQPRVMQRGHKLATWPHRAAQLGPPK